MARLVEVLGPVRLTVDGTVVTVPGRRERAVLAVLAAASGRPVGVDLLLQVLWGEDPPRTAEKTLQTYVSRLRPLLGGDEGLLLRRGRAYVLGLADEEVDARRFEAHRRAGRAAAAADDLETAHGEFVAALECWHGDEPAELSDTAAATAWRQAWATARAETIEELARTRLSTGRRAGLATWLEGALARDPDREELWALAIEAHARDGSTAAALTTFQRARDHLATTLGLDPSARLTALHEQVLAGRLGPAPARPVTGDAPAHDARAATGTDDTPAPAAGPATPGQLRLSRPPAALTAMLGRDDDVAAVEGALDTGRLVTITGAGGVGKTRLATEVAARVTAASAWCSLVPLSPDSPIERVVLDSLGLGAAPGVAPLDLAAEVIGTLDLVLVLDNAEHVLDQCRVVVGELLAACPRARLLVTSRVPLRLPGEVVVQLTPLATGDHGVAESVLEEAIGRAGGRAPSATELTGLCRDLDGLPLALELAAPMVSVLGVEAVRRGLAGHAAFLPPTPGLDGRTRDLPDTVSWSESLLPPEQRGLLRDVAAFPGVFTMSDVVELTGRPSPVVAAQLAGLCDHSLVVSEQRGGTPRFRLLVTVRAHLLDALGRTAREDLLARHAEWVATFADELTASYASAGEPRLAALLDTRVDDVDAAVHRAIDVGDHDTALRIATGLEMPAIAQMRQDFFDWIHEVAEASTGHEDPRVPRAWGNAAVRLVFADDHPGAEAAIAEGDGAVADIGCPTPLSLYDARSKLALRRYQLDEAERLFAEAGTDMATPRGVAMRGALTSFAVVRADPGVREIISDLEEQARRSGFVTNVAMAEASEAMLPGRPTEQRLTVLRDALALARSARSRLAERLILMMIAQVAVSVDEPAAGIAALREAVGAWASMGSWRFEWNTLRPLVSLLSRLDRHEDVLVLAAADAASPHSAPPLDGVDDLRGPAVERARAVLADDRAAAAWQRGSRLGDSGAVRHAMAVLAEL